MRRAAAFASAVALCFGLVRCTSDARIGGDDPEDARTPLADGADERAPTPDVDAGATANVQGVYLLLLKAGANGCGFSPWTEGSVTSADATLLQTDAAVTGDVQGLAAVTFGLLLGTTKLHGFVDGATLTLQADGVTKGTLDGGACEYTIDARITATVKGDALQDGVITYARNFGGNMQCAPFACTSTETMAGLRGTSDE